MHHALNPNATVPGPDAEVNYHGHALTATQAVLHSAQAPSDSQDATSLSQHQHSGAPGQWVLPHSEIDKYGKSKSMRYDHS